MQSQQSVQLDEAVQVSVDNLDRKHPQVRWVIPEVWDELDGFGDEEPDGE